MEGLVNGPELRSLEFSALTSDRSLIDGVLNCMVERNLNGPAPYGGSARACQA
jgi:hypothetical protein